mmetsp:Transcript_46526/g.122890  ORF Transcript_46526/g.122890 Transcript_46526/m.122890 type:complete len:200 (-) Transcript_46526:799-1398(-)|eukprot:CAMPEP_0115459628 /NCGR_PEP_ID=MMETSP0271-20121206/46350_1 /TAXON_ID=71861 /ORGANISM="Scrippsiella trochoidea, Strain CCMP3099" /LENGTH=199 /DNA_ID=CAMNT_0002886277 /DNA_START=36 /DNA_END=635 /DNA_ORIENTATION=-
MIEAPRALGTASHPQLLPQEAMPRGGIPRQKGPGEALLEGAVAHDCPVVLLQEGVVRPQALWSQLEVWDHCVVQDAASAADPDRGWATLATTALLGFIIYSAIICLLLVIPTSHPDEATLAPIRAPGILDLPIVLPLLWTFRANTKSDQGNCMIDDCVPRAPFHDAGLVHVPLRTDGDGNSNRAPLDQGNHDRRELVLR